MWVGLNVIKAGGNSQRNLFTLQFMRKLIDLVMSQP